MKNIFQTLLFVSLAVSFTYCKKDKKTDPEPLPTTNTTPSGTLTLYFEGAVGDSDLVLNTKQYTNQNSDTFNVTTYKYYISNVKFTKSDNTVWAEPDSYHLVDHSIPASTFLKIPNVPYGNYKHIQFTIGVDSVRNVSGAQTGALDPANGMFWSWNSGYIMAKMEGISPQSNATGKELTFHIGGFNGPNAVQRTFTPSLNGDSAIVSSSINATIHIKSDLLEWFQSPTSIHFNTFNTVHMAGTSAKTIADNYADMFSVEHIHNN